MSYRFSASFNAAALMGLAFFLPHPPVHAQSGTVMTIAGTGAGGFSGDGGPATNATFSGTYDLAIGPDGTLYFGDHQNHRIRAISPSTGIITTLAGTGISGGTGDGGPATNARISSVLGLAVDRARQALYLADQESSRVRKVDLTSGLISNFAGTGQFGLGGDGGPATSAKFLFLLSLATDGDGNLYIDDGSDNRVRRVDPVTGIITAFAGDGSVDFFGDGGPAITAGFSFPYQVASDDAGNVFVLDLFNINAVVRRIDATTGIINTIAGGGTNLPGTGPATSMNLISAQAIAVDPTGGKLFIGGGSFDFGNHRVVQVDLATGQLSPFAGTGARGFSGDGGPALAATFDTITALAVAPGGGLFIADANNLRLRYVAPTCVAAPSNAIAWWRGEGNALDFVGANNADQIKGSPQFVPAQVGSAMQFGGNDGFAVSDRPDLDFGVGDSFTIEAWVRVDGTFSTDSMLVEKRQATGPVGYSLSLLGPNQGGRERHLLFNIQTSNNPGQFVGVETPAIPDNHFHHVAGVLNRADNTLSIYLDGVLQQSASAAGIGSLANSGRFAIGHNSDDTIGSTAVDFDGVIDELSIFNRALTATEIQTIFTAGSAGKCLAPAAASISGLVRLGGAPLGEVTVTLTRLGGPTLTTISDDAGFYVFNNLPATGPFTVRPAKPGFAFTPSSKQLVTLTEPALVDFAATTVTYTLSGGVRSAAGLPVAGARVDLSMGAIRSTQTGTNGNYSFARLATGQSYRVTVTKDGFAFDGPKTIGSLNSDDRLHFIATTPRREISGHVTTLGGAPVAGISVSIFEQLGRGIGSMIETISTDASGNYRFAPVASDARYFVRPSAGQFLFEPPTASVLLTDHDEVADFTGTSAHRVSGRVTESGSGAGLPGVSVLFNNMLTDDLSLPVTSTFTDASGRYQSPLLADRPDYEIRPERAGFTFTPVSRLTLNLANDVAGKDFVAAPGMFSISGVFTNATGFTVGDVQVTLSGFASQQSSAGESFSFQNLSGGQGYTVKPSRAGFTFSPSNVIINPLLADVQVAFLAAARLSLTGRIAVIERAGASDGETVDAAVMNADGSARTTLTLAEAGEISVASCEPYLDPVFGVLVTPADCGLLGATSERIVCTGLALSPDGQKLAFTLTRTEVNLIGQSASSPGTEPPGTLYLRDMNSQASQPVANGVLGSPSWSADGQRLAYRRGDFGNVSPGIYLVTADGLTGGRAPGTGEDDMTPSLSPDGTQVVFARVTQRAFGSRIPIASEIVIATINGAFSIQRIVTRPGLNTDPAWSPSGGSIVYASNRDGNYDIYVTDFLGLDEFKLVGNPADDRRPAWSPDGSRVVFENDGAVHAVNVTLGASSRVFVPVGAGTVPSWGRQPTVPTGPGSDIVVESGDVTVTFETVTGQGVTTIIPVDPDSIETPSGYVSVAGSDLAFDIHTTAAVTAPIRVCVALPAEMNQATFGQLRLLHLENGQLVDRTVLPSNFASRQLCCEISSLSPFRILQQVNTSKSTITGQVLDRVGHPVPRVMVELGGAASRRTTTDAAGRFTFANLELGASYTVQPQDDRRDFLPGIGFVETIAGNSTMVFIATPRVSPILSVIPDSTLSGRFLIRWPVTSVNHVLESTASLQAANWIPVAEPASQAGTTLTVSIPLNSAARFFRLRKP